MIADRLHPGDEVRVIAPSRSLAYVWPNVCERAAAFWRDAGFRLTFSPHSRELDGFYSSSIEARVADLHEAFADPQVKLIVTAIGGFLTGHQLRRGE